MRLLAEENFPRPIVEARRADGNDVLWARSDCSGWKDAARLDSAEAQARIMLRADRDFWQIAVQHRVPLEEPGGILEAVGVSLDQAIKGRLQEGRAAGGRPRR
jgi:hypothetical protein